MLGKEHPSTQTTANNLANSLFYQGKCAEAEKVLQGALASCCRKLGPTHPDTLQTAKSLEIVQARIRSLAVRARIRTKLPTQAAALAAVCVARPPPAWTCVVLQRLAAKPKHDGKCAVQYQVAFGEQNELLLKGKSMRFVLVRCSHQCQHKMGVHAMACMVPSRAVISRGPDFASNEAELVGLLPVGTHRRLLSGRSRFT